MATEPDVVWLPPDLLVPNTWNPNRMDAFMYSKAIESIREFGFIDPITARPKNKSFEIIDGEHRWKAAKDLGLRTIPCFVLVLDDAQAKKLTILLNELRGSPDPVELGVLLKDLLETESVESLSVVLPYTDDAIKEMAKLTEIDWGSLTEPTPASPSAETKERWVERTYRMPASVAVVVDEAIEKAKDGDEIDTWRALELIAADYLSS